MRKFFLSTIIVAGLALAIAGSCSATPINYTFDMSLVGITSDPANSGLLGYDNWYQWLYKVDVVSGGDTHNGLSHFTISLQDCYTETILSAVATTQGANGNTPNNPNLSGLLGDKLRFYDFEYGTDGSTGEYGIKWNTLSDEQLDEIGEYDYFWFSVPTNQGQLGDVLVKYGPNAKYAQLLTPVCPGCDEPVVPEPATLGLMSLGLIGLYRKKRKRLS